MDITYAVNLLRSGVLQILAIAGPILAVGIGVGLIVAIFQATTSLQDQTLSIVPKIAAIIAALFILGPWIASVFVRFTVSLFQEISNMTP